MKLECLKHGDVDSARDENGRLCCPLCVSERLAAAAERKADPEEKTRQENARKLVDYLMDPERMEAHRREREAEFRDCLVEAFANQDRHSKRN